MLGFFVNNC